MKRAVVFFIVTGFFWAIEGTPWHGRRSGVIFPPLSVSRVTLAAQDVFYCPYHPEKPYDAPGRCPRCGRTLQQKETESEDGAPGEYEPHHNDAHHGESHHVED